MKINFPDRRTFSRQNSTDQQHQYELNLAGKIQRSLLPPTNQLLEGFELAGRTISCSEVGGDYFDYLYGDDVSGDNLKVIVGDVSGHGMDAALLMSSARSYIHARAAVKEEKPSEIVSALNKHFAADVEGTGHFMTMFYLDLNIQSGKVRWVRAGHDPATVYDPVKERVFDLKGSGIPIGVDDSHTYKEYQSEKLAAGTVVALGTDGVWEARNIRGDFFGKDRFKRLLKDYAGFSAKTIVEGIFTGLQQFCYNCPLADDVTVVVLKKTD